MWIMQAMINNYYTIREIVREADGTLQGAEIIECYTQERSRLVLTTARGGTRTSMIISCESRVNFLYLRKGVHRARKNTFTVLPSAEGTIIAGVGLHGGDRQVTLELEDGNRIVIQLFGARSNVYLVDKDGIVRDAFLQAKESVGNPPEPAKQTPPLPQTFQSFGDALFSEESLAVKQALKNKLPLFGSTLHRDMGVRSGVDPDRRIETLADAERMRLWDSYIEIREELTAPSPRVYFEKDVPIEMGLIHLAQYYGKSERPFQSCSDAVRTFVNTGGRQRNIDRDKKEIETRLSNELKKAERALNALTAELAAEDRSRVYKETGVLLMANPNAETKGRDTIELPNSVDSKNTISVRVDPKKSAIQNAEQYFERARKARQSRKEAERRIVSVERRYRDLEGLASQLDSVGDPKELKLFFSRNQKILSSIGIRMSKDTKEELPFRVFRVTGGYEVWTGKSSANNDLLTMKYAKPADLWFHARGASGSHVVLKTGGSGDSVPKEAIQQAASIAAYYSKMKTSKYVPVAVTERKYVRKRKGDPPGTVVVSREKVMMVEPRLPPSENEG
jgi:predicted ribosome quality control (RQC) complex YloA/Tae2 family protein